MEVQEMVVVGVIASGVADFDGPWLNQERQARLSTLIDSQAIQVNLFGYDGISQVAQ